MLALLVVASTASFDDHLTAASFDGAVINGKTSAFIKFYAPWCGHCKAMAPAWDALGGSYANDADALIGAVDCTAEADLCMRHKVEAYPTLKFIQAGDTEMQGYEGELTEQALLSAAREHLRPACTPSNRDACSTGQLAQLDSYLAMEATQRSAELESLVAPLVEAEAKLEALNERLEKLEEKVEEQEDIVDTVRTTTGPSIRLLKAVLAATDTEAAVPTKDEM